MKKMNNRYNRYQQKRQYNKSDSFDKKNRLISVLVVLSLTLLFIINHFHYENESLQSEIEMLNNEVIEKDDQISSMTKEIESLKPKPIKVIEKEKPRLFLTRTKKDTTKTVNPIVVPVVTTPVSDSL
jgi:cell division protein FtsL